MGNPLAHLPEEVEWERESPSIYLSEVFSALLDLFDPNVPQVQTVRGAYHRVRWARIAVIFSAFAAEGYINRALRSWLSNRDFAAIDRLQTIDKYALGPRIGIGKDLFDRGADPLQTLAELFELRNRMAHPKPTAELISQADLLAGPDAEAFSPTLAVRFATAVSRAALTLAQETGGNEPFAEMLLEMEGALMKAAEVAEALPRPTYEDFRQVFERLDVASLLEGQSGAEARATD